MGYTHYWSDLELEKYPDDLIAIFNTAYQDFLRVGVTIKGKHLNLFSVFQQLDEDKNLFNEHFHEYSMGASGEPKLFFIDSNGSWAFCKTARKSYDVAVVLALRLASVALGKKYSSDGDVLTNSYSLSSYIYDALDHSYEYDILKLEELYDLWLTRARDYMESDEFKEAEQRIENEKQYDRICDLPDTELDYIADQIAKGVTSIYLNNGQIVDVSFRR